MRLSICITTMNAVDALESCLKAIWQSTVKPNEVVVSDDSRSPEIQQQNCQIVARYTQTKYILGPHLGVCANRNNAYKNLSPCDFVAFIDDDICVTNDYIDKALKRYQSLTPLKRQQTFLTGGSPNRISFRGYFVPSDLPSCVDLHTAVFPTSFFELEKWDENIFFGFEDSLLCLQAVELGYTILLCPELKVIDTRAGQSTLDKGGYGKVSEYEIYIEAARLYIGIKRYREVEPNILKLIAFVIVYVVHMSAYLFRQQALKAWPDLIRHAHLEKISLLRNS